MSDLEKAKEFFVAGLAHQQQGELGAAETAYRQALEFAPDRPSVLTNLIAVLIRLQKHDSARSLNRRLLAVEPNNKAALVNEGLCAHDAGDFEGALKAFAAAAQVDPRYAEAHLNRAPTLAALHRYAEALEACNRALALRPGWPEALVNRGTVLQSLDRPRDAIDDHNEALRLRADYGAALVGRANALGEINERQQALEDYERALQIAPDNVSALLGRADMLSALGRTSEAEQAYQLALARGADPATVNFYLAGLGAGAAPKAAPSDYVAKLFDNYANRFDKHLTRSLKYQVPQFLSDALAAFYQPFPQEIVDLGCGTGLMAPLLRPRARVLDGVDLSPVMVERARERKLYDTLEVGELVEFLMRRANAYDVAAAADVLVYIGDLQPLFVAARHALRSGGLLGFSVEATEEGDYVLQSTRRYAHSPIYIERLAAQQGFRVRSLKPRVLRLNENEPIHGYIAVLGAI